MSRWARLRTLSSSAAARRYCSRWLLARSSASTSACCRRSSSASWDAPSGRTVLGSAPAVAGAARGESLALIFDGLQSQCASAKGWQPLIGPPHRGWGSAARIQGGAEEFSGHVDDRDNPLISHASWPDDPEHPDHGLPVGVGSRDHAAVIEDTVPGLVTDEDLHAFGPEAVIEQVQKIALLVERFEEPPQLLDVGELGHPHEVRLALDDVLELLFAAGLEHLLRDGNRIQHDLVHVGARLGELAQQLLADLAHRAATNLLIEIIRGTLELIGRVVTLELDDAVLHLAVVEDQHDQHAVLGESDEFDLRQRGLPRARQGDDARELRRR